jgi:C1A family cysteine protease
LIIPTVDLRPTLLPVRHQGSRRSCLAFASSTAHEHQAAFHEHLSVEYLYFHSVARTPGQNPNSGTTIDAVASALADEGQPVETAWPYSPAPITPWWPPVISSALHKATLETIEPAFDKLTAALDQNHPVIMGLIITDFFFLPDGLGQINFVPDDIERGGHAVLAVGFGQTELGVPAILIRNSWGEGWGIDGHAWLPRPYIDLHLHEAARLT